LEVPGDKEGRGVELATVSHLSAEVKNSGAIPLVPPHVFIAAGA
jgi:hypothetical protein